MPSPCLNSLVIAAAKPALASLEDDAVLRPLGAGERGRDLAEVERERIGEDRIGGQAGAVGALRLGVGLDQSERATACGRWS